MSPTTITSKDDFSARVTEIEGQEGYRRPYAFGLGLATMSDAGDRLDTWYPVVNLQENFGTAAVLASAVDHTDGTASYLLSPEDLTAILEQFNPFVDDGERHTNVEAMQDLARVSMMARKQLVATFIGGVQEEGEDAGTAIDDITDISDAYLRLHLLSHLKVLPNGINLNGLFGQLKNVAWTNEGPIAIDELNRRRIDAMVDGRRLTVQSQDKFPSMLDYVTAHPTVRIINGRNIRLGADPGAGTTMMTAASMNFDAGTEGPNMIEGRVSAHVYVEHDTDMGGGASTMGTLSGGGEEIVRIGPNCLIGANAGSGISLGARCTIEAGLYVTAGMPVFDLDNNVEVKAGTLSGDDNLMFIRHSRTGRVEVKRKANEVELNDELHT